MPSAAHERDVMDEQPAPRLSRMPDTLLIIAAAALVAWAATFLFAPGRFAVTEGPKPAPIAGSFVAQSAPQAAPIFGTDGEVGLLNLLFEGLSSGDRMGSTVGLAAFLLVIGGTFGIILNSGAIDRALGASLAGGRAATPALLVGLFALFSAAGAVFGMGEEAIALTLVLAPALRRAGYDSLTAVVVCYGATQVGFATSWMNPFSVIVAQTIAGVPVLSGLELRLFMWMLFTGLGALFLWRYATVTRSVPEVGPLPGDEAAPPGLRRGDTAILLATLAAVGWVAWGVVARGWYLPELAAQFMALGLFAGVVSWRFRLAEGGANGVAHAFRDGAAQMLPAILIIAAARGILLLLGGDDPAAPSLLNSLLAGLAAVAGALPQWLTAWGMLGAQSVINLFIVSGSGQAAVTMPLMAPLADLTGVTRQTAVLAFQLGDGLTNLIVPSSAGLMGSLAAARVDYADWLRFFWKPMLGLYVLASGFVIAAQAIGYA